MNHRLRFSNAQQASIAETANKPKTVTGFTCVLKGTATMALLKAWLKLPPPLV
jgi:hypothetical protein